MRSPNSTVVGSQLMSMSTSMRVINRARVIFLIRRQPGLTRAQISRLTGLSKATVSNHVSDLLEAGLLHEDQQNGSRQRNTGLRLNREAGLAVGIELAPDEVRGVLSDTSIRPLRRIQRHLGSTGVEETTQAILALVGELTSAAQGPLLGMVVGVPGSTDESGKSLVFSESLGWSGVPLADSLAGCCELPVRLVNRSRAGALGEHWLGAGVDVDDLIYISVSSGIAAGIVIGGQLFTGAKNNGGEIGHTTVLLDGPPCVCGNRGCLETVASMQAVMKATGSRLAAGEQSSLAGMTAIAVADVVAAARDGDSLAVEEVRNASRYLGVAVANLIDLFNPAMVVIGGQLAEAGEIVVSTVRNTAQRKAFPPSFEGVQIVRNALGPDSVCIGACAMVVDQYVQRLGPAIIPPAGNLLELSERRFERMA